MLCIVLMMLAHWTELNGVRDDYQNVSFKVGISEIHKCKCQFMLAMGVHNVLTNFPKN